MAIDIPGPLTRLLEGGTVSQILEGLSLRIDDGQNLPFLALTSIIAIFTTSTIVKLFRGLARVGYVDGYRRPFFPYSIPGLLFPSSFLNPGYVFLWRWRYHNYKRFKSEIFSYIGWLGGNAVIFTSNLDILRQVAGGAKSDFVKPMSASRGLMQWGMNVAAAEGGDEWRKHRRVLGPSFSTNLYRLVWSKTAATYREMSSVEGWDGQKVVEINSVQKYIFKMALVIMGACGFGLNLSWTDQPVSADGKVSMQEALKLINDRQIVLQLPKWIQNLPFKYFNEYREAKIKFTEWMTEQVALRKDFVRNSVVGDDASGPRLPDDCFTLLVKANEDEGQKFRLSDQELIGNVFVLLFAGHETSAHTFAATFAHLALYPEIQEEVLEQILSVVGWDRDPEFEDYNSLNKVLAVFYEALRLFPAGHVMFRQATKDTVLRVQNPPGEEGTYPLPLPKGSMVVVDMVGVQYNERYFDEPEKYKPSRWYNIPNDSEAFTAFSLGPRACIGRKFATVEAVSFLSLFLRDWKIEPLLNPGETVEQWKARIVDAQLFVTLGIKNVPIRLVKRERL
ncbi:hypothetical protein CC1G_06640 [Coprinopsis cinerea okayama7|uniref:Cytochrome P450 n=1 Tax=Coprinopsis cinerea (strain Okayama-7 / 130 / ATCC MYA-4618 / FGSC 9003) TaxID=240176 RepID=A8P7U4_COPC7|nr:hypothetical protein CC1G_06640 [Coprinopsis cinerea okayama7\|eukprot:XP_001839427.1 hypothetical protein CC1G_06640 [Coprinopsis cinerea okayama7\